jgi:hypothetical protein
LQASPHWGAQTEKNKNKEDKMNIVSIEGRNGDIYVNEDGTDPTLEQLDKHLEGTLCGLKLVGINNSPDHPEKEFVDYGMARDGSAEQRLHDKTNWPLCLIKRIKKGSHPGPGGDWITAEGGVEAILEEC